MDHVILTNGFQNAFENGSAKCLGLILVSEEVELNTEVESLLLITNEVVLLKKDHAACVAPVQKCFEFSRINIAERGDTSPAFEETGWFKSGSEVS